MRMCDNGVLDLQPLAFNGQHKHCQLIKQELAKLTVASVLGACEMGICKFWHADISACLS